MTQKRKAVEEKKKNIFYPPGGIEPVRAGVSVADVRLREPVHKAGLKSVRASSELNGTAPRIVTQHLKK